MNGTEATATAPPVIDADELQLRKLYLRYGDLLCERNKMKDQYLHQYEIASAPITEEMGRVCRQIDELRPKPQCFGTKDHGYIAGCDDCRVGMSCYRQLKETGGT